MLNEGIIIIATAALADVDLSSHRARIADIDGRLGDIDGALAAGAAQVRELGDRIARLRSAGPDRAAAAEALLAGQSVRERLPGPEALAEEKETITAGLNGLRAKRRDLEVEREAAKAEMSAALSDTFAPVLDALEQEAVALARRWADLIVTASAVQRATKQGAADRLVRRMYDARSAMRAERFADGEGQIAPELIDLLVAAEDARKVPAPPRYDPAASRVQSPPQVREGPIAITRFD